MSKNNAWRIAVLTARFNEQVTKSLEKGAIAYLTEQGIAVAPEDIFAAPGAFEIPMLASALARTGRYDAVVTLGCVIKRETAHFEFVSLGATIGVMQAQLDTGVPIAFGVITTYTDEQAAARSGDDANNKGREAAAAALEALHTLAAIKAAA